MEKQNGLRQWLSKQCREEGLSLRQAAARTGLSHGTLADILSGKSQSPSAETVRKLARGFGGGSVLRDHLLLLAGYRAPRPDEPSEELAKLIDKVRNFDDRQIRIMAHFADFLTEKG